MSRRDVTAGASTATPDRSPQTQIPLGTYYDGDHPVTASYDPVADIVHVTSEGAGRKETIDPAVWFITSSQDRVTLGRHARCRQSMQSVPVATVTKRSQTGMLLVRLAAALLVPVQTSFVITRLLADMTDPDRSGRELDEAVRTRLERVLSRYPISFAMVFGSASRGTSDEQSDVDLAIEFDDLRPDDADYNDVYLSLIAELEETLSSSVDVVDVHTMSPEFARAAFEDGSVVLGSAARRSTLEAEVAAGELSAEDARERVAASVARLRANET